ncbi:hypothetical protein ACB092_01G315500 [Castanea dentata]
MVSFFPRTNLLVTSIRTQTQKYPSTINSIVMALCLFAVVDNIWLNHGKDITNRSYANDEFFVGKDISATPIVDSGVVYFPSWNEYLYAVNAFTGASIWKQNLSEITGLNGTGIVVNVTMSRSTPMIVDDLLIVGIYRPTVLFSGRLKIWTQNGDHFRTISFGVNSPSNSWIRTNCLL